jgi:superfamily II DNA or RNA helicase
VALGHVCESVSYQYGIEPAIEDGWLVPVVQSVVTVEGLDFSKARTVASDFNQADLERILTEERPLHEMCASAMDLIKDRQALWFCASVQHAKDVATVLARYTGSVAFLSGATPKEERRKAVDAYKSGTIRHLLNCALFLEGFDAPSTSAIVMARPTKSLGLYTQVLGRGTRPLPGLVDGLLDAAARRQAILESLKPNTLVIDFAGNAGKHQIVTAADVLGGKYEPETRKAARDLIEAERRPMNLEEALARAGDEQALLLEEAQKRRLITARANYTAREVGLFAGDNGAHQQGPRRAVGEPATHGQVWKIYYLSRELGLGWTVAKAETLSKRQACGVIRSLLEKKGRGNDD